jgi:hypothetical protein
MANRRLNLTGVTFGYLTAVEPVGATPNGLIIWKFTCVCGESVERVGSNILRDKKKGVTSSCGCKAPLVTHNLSRKFGKLHRVWVSMRQRCRNPNNKDYVNYGARGIDVCESWESFENFHSWALSTGYREKVTIERIDVDKGYSPDNCTWVANEKQALNTRKIRTFPVNGKRMTFREISEMTGTNIQTLKSRLQTGWSIEEMVTGVRKCL